MWVLGRDGGETVGGDEVSEWVVSLASGGRVAVWFLLLAAVYACYVPACSVLPLDSHTHTMNSSGVSGVGGWMGISFFVFACSDGNIVQHDVC